jgi:glycosyltransferase involved in cell wall biosynthesis
MLTVSVVTAVRNGAGTILRTLESIQSQSYPDIEHIVVDGASTDSTLDILRSHGSRNLSLISEKDSGVYDAFNKGVRRATGDVIGFLNCGDTYFSPDVLARIAAGFADPTIDAVFGDVLIVDEHDLEIAVRRYKSSRFRPSMIGYGIMPAHPTLFLRRSVYQKFGEYDASFRIAGDFEFVARVFARGNVSYSCLDEILVRMPRGGLSTSGPRASWTITREIRRACAQNGVSTNYRYEAARVPSPGHLRG